MKQPNILLLVMDTSRSDCVKEKHLMPNLHDFSTSSTWFLNAFANAPWTLPSHSSIFTGRYPSEHGTTGVEKFFHSNVNLMTELRRTGYHTASFSNNPWISPDFGFDDFDESVPCWQPFRRGADLASVSQEEELGQQLWTLAGELTDLDAPFTIANALYMKFVEGRYDSGAALTNYRFKRWLTNRETTEPFFALVNYMEPHLEYNPPQKHRELFLNEDEFDRWDAVNQDPWAHVTGTAQMDDADFNLLRNLYRAELHYLDARLGRLFDLLERRGILDSTAVIVTGDHGEHLGEHGLMDHQYSLHESLLHVPLVIRYPEEFEQGQRDDRLVELRDLFPTILSLADVDDPPTDNLDNPPLDLTADKAGRDAVIAEYLSPQPSIDTLCSRYDVDRESIAEYDRALRTIRTSERKLIEGSDGSRELFAVNEDGVDEANALDETGDELASQLREVIGPFERIYGSTDRRELPESNKQRLEDLGYL